MYYAANGKLRGLGPAVIMLSFYAFTLTACITTSEPRFEMGDAKMDEFLADRLACKNTAQKSAGERKWELHVTPFDPLSRGTGGRYHNQKLRDEWDLKYYAAFDECMLKKEYLARD